MILNVYLEDATQEKIREIANEYNLTDSQVFWAFESTLEKDINDLDNPIYDIYAEKLNDKYSDGALLQAQQEADNERLEEEMRGN